MKDFITYDIESELKQHDVYQKGKNELSDFKWRMGDSDSQGKYVSGRDHNGVTLKLWLETNTFIAMSVCFTDVWEDCNDREAKKENLIDLIEKKFISSIGVNIKKSEAD